MPNRLTPLYFKIYYKKENHLKVKTVVFKYINSSIIKVKYIDIFLYFYILMFLYSKLLVICHLCDLAYPLSYGFTSFINPISCVLILTQYKSLFSTCTILFIKSVTLNIYIYFGVLIYIRIYKELAIKDY